MINAEEIHRLCSLRAEAKKKKSFDEADSIRGKVYEMGYEIRDLPGGRWTVRKRMRKADSRKGKESDMEKIIATHSRVESVVSALREIISTTELVQKLVHTTGFREPQYKTSFSDNYNLNYGRRCMKHIAGVAKETESILREMCAMMKESRERVEGEENSEAKK